MVARHSVPEISEWQRPSPHPGSRIKPEGVPNYIRNRGCLERVAFDSPCPLSFTPRPDPRCPTSASRSNYKLGWHGNVGPLLNGTATSRPTTAPPRITPEGEEIASVSRGKRMRRIIHEYARNTPTPRQPRVRSEAKATAGMAKGGRMYNILHKYGAMPLSARAVPRVRPEGQGIATLSKGKRTKDNIHQYGHNEVTSRPLPRVKPEADDNSRLDRGHRMDRLLHSWQLTTSAPPPPRVNPEGSDSAELARGRRMARLLFETDRLPCTSRPEPRAIGPSAQANLWRGITGTVGKCLLHSGRKTFIFLPGEQKRAYSRSHTV